MPQKLYFIVETTRAMTEAEALAEFPGVPWEKLADESTVRTQPGYTKTFRGELGPPENPVGIRAWIRNLVV